MGLILFSLILAVVVGCCLWLVVGETLPVNQEEKWPLTNNIILSLIHISEPTRPY